MDFDVHLLKTKKSINKVKALIGTEIFGNYDVSENSAGSEFGIFLYRYNKDLLVLKLYYSFYNYRDVSLTVMEHLGKLLKCEYWLIGMVVEYNSAYVEYYKYDKKKDKMCQKERIENVDGTKLTPEAKEKWKFDSHDIWAKMKDKMDTETNRQILTTDGTIMNAKTTFESKEIIKENWIKKYGSLDNLKKKVCECMYFVAHKDIEQYRPDITKLQVVKKKLGKVFVEDGVDGTRVRTVIPAKPEGQVEVKQ